MNRLKQRVRQIIRPEGDANGVRVHRRMKIVSIIYNNLTALRTILFIAGYLWMLVIPSPRLGRSTYSDENALAPAQVNTHWTWGDVHVADRYLEQLELLRDQNSTSEQRASFLEVEFHKLGLTASTQAYEFTTSSGTLRGHNAYAVLASPRTSGIEAMVISASWLSRTGEGDGTLNLRGVATILALAKFLKKYSHWSKDIILVISDGYLDGMQAWLAEYHGVSQSNLQAQPLSLESGVIWTALNIDYPGHSFSHLGIFFEGINGRLPNQDLINSFKHIAQTTGGVPVVLYDHVDFRDDPDLAKQHTSISWLPNIIKHDPAFLTYAYHTQNIIRHAYYQSLGRPSGVHGLFHQFRIDAITIFGVPASGPHGFHAIGRIVESTMRTMNNLLERLHASFFFYILAGSNPKSHRFPSFSHFLKIGSYLPSAILISVAMMFGGLKEWVDVGHTTGLATMEDKTSSTNHRHRSVLAALVIMTCTHLLGGVLFFVIRSSFFVLNQTFVSLPVLLLFSILPYTSVHFILQAHKEPNVSLAPVLRALTSCFASTVISVSTVLNFSFAAALSILLGIPLSVLSRPRKSQTTRLIAYAMYAAFATGWLIVLPHVTKQAIWDWEVLGVWVAPIVCIMYYPLVIQAALASLL